MSVWRRLRDVFGLSRPDAVGDDTGRSAAEAHPGSSPEGQPGLAEVDALRGQILSAGGSSSPYTAAAIETAFASLCAMGAEAEALSALEFVLPMQPGSVELVALAARHHAKRRNDERVVALLSVAAGQLGANDLLLLADSLERLGRREHALGAIEAALGRDVNVPGGRERLARLMPKSDGRPANDATLVGGVTEPSSKYRVLGSLGRGGAGVVLHAEDVIFSRHVALKTYHSRGPAALARVLVEARMAARFSDPAVIRVFDVDPDRCAIVMEFHALGSLADAIDARALSADGVLLRLRELSQALSLVHRSGVVHRDVKASNVLLRDDGVVLSDFGLARQSGTSLTPGDLHDGTPGVVPPGLTATTLVEPWFDVFAFGRLLSGLLVAYPALSGRLSALATRCIDTTATDRLSADDIDMALR